MLDEALLCLAAPPPTDLQGAQNSVLENFLAFTTEVGCLWLLEESSKLSAWQLARLHNQGFEVGCWGLVSRRSKWVKEKKNRVMMEPNWVDLLLE